MIEINKDLISELFAKAEASERKRINYDLRTSAEDNSQRMLNALLPGTIVPVHRHPMSNENVILLQGRLVEIVFEEVVPQAPREHSSEAEFQKVSEFQVGGAFEHAMDAQDVMRPRIRLVEKERITLDPSTGAFGCVVPAGAWHTVEVLEPSVIYEAKDGKYGEDGSETFGTKTITITKTEGTNASHEDPSQSSAPESCLGDLRSQITYLIGMERQSGSMEVITPLYVSRMLNVPLEEVEEAMKAIQDK